MAKDLEARLDEALRKGDAGDWRKSRRWGIVRFVNDGAMGTWLPDHRDLTKVATWATMREARACCPPNGVSFTGDRLRYHVTRVPESELSK